MATRGAGGTPGGGGGGGGGKKKKDGQQQNKTTPTSPRAASELLRLCDSPDRPDGENLNRTNLFCKGAKSRHPTAHLGGRSLSSVAW
mgnify:CR=1 FL=1